MHDSTPGRHAGARCLAVQGEGEWQRTECWYGHARRCGSSRRRARQPADVQDMSTQPSISWPTVVIAVSAIAANVAVASVGMAAIAWARR